MIKRRLLLALYLLLTGAFAFSQQVDSKPKLSELYPTLESKEQALNRAIVIKSKKLGTGITNPLKLTMRDGENEFYAVFKNVDIHKAGMTQMQSGSELDFKDSWKYDVAAYELDKLLGMNMVPVTVERRYEGENGAVVWWIENAMTEGNRIEKKLTPPNLDSWNQAIYKIRLFDNLVYNIDRNLGNLLITPDWKIWMIDHSRCFKNVSGLKSKNDLSHFSLSVIKALKNLNEADVKEHCGKYLSIFEIRAMMKRRDAIVQQYATMYAQSGDSILFP
jgi:hypothetical protein